MYNLLLTVSSKLVLIITVLIGCLLLYVNWSLKYWQRKKVPHLPPTIPFGNLENPFSPSGKCLGEQYKRLYEKLKSKGLKYAGFYSFITPTYMPLHPDYVKSVLIKDFEHFHARGFYLNEKDQPLEANLFTVDGNRWRNLRAKFTPTFTSGKIKLMFQIFSDCSVAMGKNIAMHVSENRPVNIKHITACYTTDVIGNCAFGLECNSFENTHSTLLDNVKLVMKNGLNLNRLAFCHAFPKLARSLKMVLLPKHAMNYFAGIIKDTIAYRDTSQTVRNDFLQLLINMRQSAVLGDDSNTITEIEIAAQSFLFYLAGHETSASTMTFCLYELAQHQDFQQKVRDEIRFILSKYEGRVSYDALAEMKYLQQVVDETLRKYPIVPFINRKCTADYVIPNTDIVIEKGTLVVVSVLGLHHDPEYYPEPEKFDPERFCEKRGSLKYHSAYFPFGEGPRKCLGLRFGMFQVKFGLGMLLKDFVFSVNPKTKIPVTFDSYIVLTSKEDILLDVKKYKNDVMELLNT